MNIESVSTTNAFSALEEEDASENNAEIEMVAAISDSDSTQSDDLLAHDEPDGLEEVVFTSPDREDLLVDVSKFFRKHIRVEEAHITDTTLKLRLKNRIADEKTLDLVLWKWEKLKLDFTIQQSPDSTIDGGTILLLDYWPKEENDSWNQESGILGWAEMKLIRESQEQGWERVGDEENFKAYACLRLDWDHDRKRIIPTFFDHRIIFGGDQLANEFETIPIPNPVSRVLSEVYFDQTLTKLRLHNIDHAEVVVHFQYLHPKNIGVRYFFPGWENPQINPTKKAFTIPHKESAEVAISFRLPRTREHLQKLAQSFGKGTNNGLLVTLKMVASGTDRHINLHFVWEKNEMKWKVHISEQKPEGDWPRAKVVSRERPKFRIN